MAGYTDYVYLKDRLIAQRGANPFSYHTDVLGSPLAATNGSGAQLWRENYQPYGRKLLNQGNSSNALWFTGKSHDEDTKLTYFGARFYDPLLGRFMGVDPQDFDEANLHSFNRYAYGNNNPYKFVDPNGQAALLALFAPVIASTAGAVIGGGSTPPFNTPPQELFSGVASVGFWMPWAMVLHLACWELGQSFQGVLRKLGLFPLLSNPAR